MRDAWEAAFAARARDYWTPERTAALMDGKRLAIRPDEAPALLRALGILHRDASMPPQERRKFFQINHMVTLLMPSLRPLADAVRGRRPLRIVDAACGRSYLTLLLAHALDRHLACPVQVLGVDRNAALMLESVRRTEAAGLQGLVRHHAAMLHDLEPESAFRAAFTEAGAGDFEGVDAVVSLHACDTATDDALVLARRLEARLVAVAPCCQAELAAAWARAPATSGPFAAVHRSPHLRRQLAATLTDTLRTQLMVAVGYAVQALEFVPTEHTPKNLLLRGMLRDPAAKDETALDEYRALRDLSGGHGLGLADRLAPWLPLVRAASATLDRQEAP
jgi:SAM-dependent methyltransferase